MMELRPRGWRLVGWILLLLTLVPGIGAVQAADQHGNGVKWYSYPEGLALGKQEGKKIFLTFHADWCAYCHKMDRESFGNAEIIEYLNRHFISVKADSDKETQLARDFFVRGLPSSWFLDSGGDKIAGQPGYIPPKQLLQLLQFIQSDSYKEMSFKEFAQNK